MLCVFCGGLDSVGDASADLGGVSESSCSSLGEFECECDECDEWEVTSGPGYKGEFVAGDKEYWDELR